MTRNKRAFVGAKARSALMGLTDPLFRRRIQDWASGCMADLKRVNNPTYRTLCLEKWLKELRVEIIRPTIETKLYRRESDTDLQIWGSVVYYQSCREIESRIHAEIPTGMMDAPLFNQLKPTEEQLARIKLMQTAPLFKERPKASEDTPTNSSDESETAMRINTTATLQKLNLHAVLHASTDPISSAIITKSLYNGDLAKIFVTVNEEGLYTITETEFGNATIELTTNEGTHSFGELDLNNPTLANLVNTIKAKDLLVLIDAEESTEVLENIQAGAAADPAAASTSSTPNEESTAMNNESTSNDKPNVVVLHSATALAFILLLGLAAVILGLGLGQLALLLSSVLSAYMPALAAQIIGIAVVVVGVVGVHALTGAMNYVVGGALWVSNFVTVTAPKWFVGLFRKDDAAPAAA